MKFGKDDVVIEVDDEKADQWVFNPAYTRGPLRGRYEYHKLPRAMNRKGGFFTKAIPGMYIWLNVKEKKAGIVDPLGFPENASLADEIAAYREVKRFVPERSTERVDMTANDIATWWHWMNAAVTRKGITGINEQMPEDDRITRAAACKIVYNGHLLDESNRPPGRIQIDFRSVEPYNWKTKEGTPVFMDEFEDRRRRDLPADAGVANP